LQQIAARLLYERRSRGGRRRAVTRLASWYDDFELRQDVVELEAFVILGRLRRLRRRGFGRLSLARLRLLVVR